MLAAVFTDHGICYLHHPLTVHPKKSASQLLQLNCRQRERLPFACWFIQQLCDLGMAGSKTSFEKYDNCHAIKEAMPSPCKVDIHVFPTMHELDTPEFLCYEIFDPEISINHEA